MLTKSGVFWVSWANTNAQNSNNIEDLVEPFRSDAKAFIAALQAGGARVNVTATKRSARRAYLFHWSWKIALGKCEPSEAGEKTGVDILWDHGEDVASKRGAQEMVSGFALAVPPRSINAPALTSNHPDRETHWLAPRSMPRNRQQCAGCGVAGRNRQPRR
jgi:hypothetical protein